MAEIDSLLPEIAHVLRVLSRRAIQPGPGTDPVELRTNLESLRGKRGPALRNVRDCTLPEPRGDLRARIYRDAPEPTAGTLLYFHGGGFVAGSIDTHDGFCRTVALKSQWTVVSIDYALAPEAPYPAAVDDAYAALRWVSSDAGAALGIRPDHVVVCGDSAGGCIAAALAIAARDRVGPCIAAQILINPVLDPACDTSSHRTYGDGYFLTSAAVRWFWQQYLGEHLHRPDALAAPARAELSGLPPALVLTAGLDPLRDEGERFAERLADAGVSTQHICFKNAIHGFVAMLQLVDAQDAIQKIAQYCRASGKS